MKKTIRQLWQSQIIVDDDGAFTVRQTQLDSEDEFEGLSGNVRVSALYERRLDDRECDELLKMFKRGLGCCGL